MRDLLDREFNEPLEGHDSIASNAALMQNTEFRALARRALLSLSTLLSFGGLINIIDRQETHLGIWVSLGASIAVLILVSRVAATSPHFINYGISFGVCCVSDSASAEDWLDKADAAMYAAKHAGGDLVKMAS